jgi:DNA-binding NarL/FixJ family response regulator
MHEDYSRLTPKDNQEVGSSLQDFKKLLIGGEKRFLLACLSKGFNPSFIYVGKSNFGLALAYKAIGNTKDLLGAATSSPKAIGLLKRCQPGFVFIHERAEKQEYADLIEYLSESGLAVKSLVLVDSLKLLENHGDIDADAIVADQDIFLPANPLAQGLMAMVAGTEYRSPSAARSLNQNSPTTDQTSPTRIKLGLRDQQLLEAYVLGLSNREVAEKLNLSVRTVQTYSGNLLERLGVNNRQKALLAASRMGISVAQRYFQ